MSNIFLEQAKVDRFAELDAKRHALSTDEQKEYLSLLQENSKITSERGSKIASLKQQLTDLKVSVLELYTPDDFDQSAAQSLILGLQEKFKFHGPEVGFSAAVGKAKASKAPRATSNKTSTPRPSDANKVVITIKPEGVGRSLTYHQGRIWEHASDAVKKPYTKFPDGLLKAVNENNLESYADAAWAKTAAGKEELEAIKWAVQNADKKVEDNPHKPKASAKDKAAA
ncbi:hypothetical protein [Paraburkholderia tropica]|uniref:hypothetical protein n=1 Tax=Paraburkholderia tropica TaxID=92647 RepID=UPI003D29F244